MWEVVALRFVGKKHRELYTVVSEVLAVCGIERSVLDELLALERRMTHNVGIVPATVSATEQQTIENGNATN